MTILDRYIIKEFLRFLILILLSLLTLSVFIDFFEKIRMFLSNQATFAQMSRYFFLALPMLLSLIFPAAVLLAALVTFGSFSRYHEITALKAGGVSLYRISLPVMVLALLFSSVFFFFNEYITPLANEKADHLIRVEVQKQQPLGSFSQNELWYRGKLGIYNFRLFDPATNTLHGVTITQHDARFHLIKRLDAQQAVWQKGQWHFHNLLITRFSPQGEPQLEWVTSQVVPLGETPDDFKVVQKSADKMGYFELRRYIYKLKSEGYDVTRLETDLQGKLAFSLVIIILTVIGIAFSLKTERSGALARSIGVGIVIGFSYWIIFALSISLGKSGTLSPILAAWLTNGLFGLGALVLVMRVKT